MSLPFPEARHHRDPNRPEACHQPHNIERHLVSALGGLGRVPLNYLLSHRYDRRRRMGKFIRSRQEAIEQAGRSGSRRAISRVQVADDIKPLDRTTNHVSVMGQKCYAPVDRCSENPAIASLKSAALSPGSRHHLRPGLRQRGSQGNAG